jgi:hypothetical protein
LEPQVVAKFHNHVIYNFSPQDSSSGIPTIKLLDTSKTLYKKGVPMKTPFQYQYSSFASRQVHRNAARVMSTIFS